ARSLPRLDERPMKGLGREDVHVLVAAAPDDPDELGGALDVLSDDERARTGRFRRRADAASFAGGRALVRLALAQLVGAAPRELVFDTWCEVHSRPHGKPR